MLFSPETMNGTPATVDPVRKSRFSKASFTRSLPARRVSPVSVMLTSLPLQILNLAKFHRLAPLRASDYLPRSGS